MREGSPNGDDGSAVGGSAAMEKMATLEGNQSEVNFNILYHNNIFTSSFLVYHNEMY